MICDDAVFYYSIEEFPLEPPLYYLIGDKGGIRTPGAFDHSWFQVSALMTTCAPCHKKLDRLISLGIEPKMSALHANVLPLDYNKDFAVTAL